MHAVEELPPGPAAPAAAQTVEWIARPTDLLRRSAAISARCASIRAPWNGGSIWRRRRRCASPLVTRIELGPANGSSTVELAPPRSTSPGAA